MYNSDGTAIVIGKRPILDNEGNEVGRIRTVIPKVKNIDRRRFHHSTMHARRRAKRSPQVKRTCERVSQYDILRTG